MDPVPGVLLTQPCAWGTIYARLHARLCGITYPLSDMESLPRHSSPSPWWVLPSCNRDIAPPFFFFSFFFALIEIQLGTQTMPASWHILERGECDNNIRLLPHITFVPPPIIMDQCQLVTGYFFLFLLLIISLLFTRWSEVFIYKTSCL